MTGIVTVRFAEHAKAMLDVVWFIGLADQVESLADQWQIEATRQGQQTKNLKQTVVIQIHYGQSHSNFRWSLRLKLDGVDSSLLPFCNPDRWLFFKLRRKIIYFYLQITQFELDSKTEQTRIFFVELRKTERLSKTR